MEPVKATIILKTKRNEKSKSLPGYYVWFENDDLSVIGNIETLLDLRCGERVKVTIEKYND